MAENKTATNATMWTFLSDRAVRIERVYDAPRELVFRAYTDPTLIAKWWGPAYLTTTVEKMDVRPGGAWRYVQRDPDGNVYGFHGEYREVDPPARLRLDVRVRRGARRHHRRQCHLRGSGRQDEAGRSRRLPTTLRLSRACWSPGCRTAPTRPTTASPRFWRTW